MRLTVSEGLKCFEEDLEAQWSLEGGLRVVGDNVDHVDLRHACFFPLMYIYIFEWVQGFWGFGVLGFLL